MSSIEKNILKALDEEQQHPKRPWTYLGFGFVAAFMVLYGIASVLFFEMPPLWPWVFIYWSALFGFGIYKYRQPQVRVEIAGFWTPFAFAKLLLISLLVIVCQLILCPHFSFVETALTNQFTWLRKLSDFYMSLGGVNVCLWLCGLSYGLLAGAGAAAWVWRTLCWRNWKLFFKASGIVLLFVWPLIFWQGGHAEHGDVSFWLGGTYAGILLGMLLVAGLKRKAQTHASIKRPEDLLELQSQYLSSRPTSFSENSSPFFDQAQTHTYSDWLLPKCLDTGWTYEDEDYEAGFPNLSEVLVKSAPIRFHRDIFWEYRARGLLPLGEKLSEVLPGKVMIDLGCGQPNYSPAPRLIAEAFDALFYWGVDQNISKDELRKSEFNLRQDFYSFFTRAEIFQFLDRLNPSSHYVIFMAGLELKNREGQELERVREQWERVLLKVLLPGSYVLCGAGSRDIAMQSSGFKLIFEDRFHRLYERR